MEGLENLSYGMVKILNFKTDIKKVFPVIIV